MSAITRFRDEYAFLSNFQAAAIEFEGETYPTVEHAYQAAKTLDVDERAHIRAAPTPAAAKHRGKRCHLRPDWDEMKLKTMEKCLRAKFDDPALRAKLLATGDRELVETNDWRDRLWGVYGGTGQNHLGRLLMKVRAELRATAGPARRSAGQARSRLVPGRPTGGLVELAIVTTGCEALRTNTWAPGQREEFQKSMDKASEHMLRTCGAGDEARGLMTVCVYDVHGDRIEVLTDGSCASSV